MADSLDRRLIDDLGNFSTTIDTNTLPANATGYDVALDLPQSTNFNGVTDNTLKLVVNKASQSITFGALAGKTFGDARVRRVGDGFVGTRRHLLRQRRGMLGPGRHGHHHRRRQLHDHG